MSKSAIALVLVLGSVGCAAPRGANPPPAADLDPVRRDLAQIQHTLALLDNRLAHLESESAENELTEMTIDRVIWADEKLSPGMAQGDPKLLGHVKEWRGFGKMLRFTRKADLNFVLEADGHRRVHANAGEGGICNVDGSTRYIILSLNEKLVPDATYRLRPQNGNDKYRWSVPTDVTVLAADASR
jgi:hypothetical protein